MCWFWVVVAMDMCQCHYWGIPKSCYRNPSSNPWRTGNCSYPTWVLTDIPRASCERRRLKWWRRTGGFRKIFSMYLGQEFFFWQHQLCCKFFMIFPSTYFFVWFCWIGFLNDHATLKEAKTLGVKVHTGFGSFEEWHRVAGNSKVSLCPRGFGRTAYHLVEILQLGITHLFRHPLGAISRGVRENWFQHWFEGFADVTEEDQWYGFARVGAYGGADPLSQGKPFHIWRCHEPDFKVHEEWRRLAMFETASNQGGVTLVVSTVWNNIDRRSRPRAIVQDLSDICSQPCSSWQ